MSYYVGKAVKLANWAGPSSNPSGGYRNTSGALYDPSAPSLRYRLPGGNVTTVSGGSLTHDGTGLYSYVLTPSASGDAMATYLSGDGAYSDPVTFKIEPAPL